MVKENGRRVLRSLWKVIFFIILFVAGSTASSSSSSKTVELTEGFCERVARRVARRGETTSEEIPPDSSLLWMRSHCVQMYLDLVLIEMQGLINADIDRPVESIREQIQRFLDGYGERYWNGVSPLLERIDHPHASAQEKELGQNSRQNSAKVEAAEARELTRSEPRDAMFEKTFGALDKDTDGLRPPALPDGARVEIVMVGPMVGREVRDWEEDGEDQSGKDDIVLCPEEVGKNAESSSSKKRPSSPAPTFESNLEKSAVRESEDENEDDNWAGDWWGVPYYASGEGGRGEDGCKNNIAKIDGENSKSERIPRPSDLERIIRRDVGRAGVHPSLKRRVENIPSVVGDVVEAARKELLVEGDPESRSLRRHKAKAFWSRVLGRVVPNGSGDFVHAGLPDVWMPDEDTVLLSDEAYETVFVTAKTDENYRFRSGASTKRISEFDPLFARFFTSHAGSVGLEADKRLRDWERRFVKHPIRYRHKLNFHGLDDSQLKDELRTRYHDACLCSVLGLSGGRASRDKFQELMESIDKHPHRGIVFNLKAASDRGSIASSGASISLAFMRAMSKNAPLSSVLGILAKVLAEQPLCTRQLARSLRRQLQAVRDIKAELKKETRLRRPSEELIFDDEVFVEATEVYETYLEDLEEYSTTFQNYDVSWKDLAKKLEDLAKERHGEEIWKKYLPDFFIPLAKKEMCAAVEETTIFDDVQNPDLERVWFESRLYHVQRRVVERLQRLTTERVLHRGRPSHLLMRVRPPRLKSSNNNPGEAAVLEEADELAAVLEGERSLSEEEGLGFSVLLFAATLPTSTDVDVRDNLNAVAYRMELPGRVAFDLAPTPEGPDVLYQQGSDRTSEGPSSTAVATDAEENLENVIESLLGTQISTLQRAQISSSSFGAPRSANFLEFPQQVPGRDHLPILLRLCYAETNAMLAENVLVTVGLKDDFLLWRGLNKRLGVGEQPEVENQNRLLLRWILSALLNVCQKQTAASQYSPWDGIRMLWRERDDAPGPEKTPLGESLGIGFGTRFPDEEIEARSQMLWDTLVAQPYDDTVFSKYKALLSSDDYADCLTGADPLAPLTKEHEIEFLRTLKPKDKKIAIEEAEFRSAPATLKLLPEVVRSAQEYFLEKKQEQGLKRNGEEPPRTTESLFEELSQNQERIPGLFNFMVTLRPGWLQFEPFRRAMWSMQDVVLEARSSSGGVDHVRNGHVWSSGIPLKSVAIWNAGASWLWYRLSSLAESAGRRYGVEIHRGFLLGLQRAVRPSALELVTQNAPVSPTLERFAVDNLGDLDPHGLVISHDAWYLYVRLLKIAADKNNMPPFLETFVGEVSAQCSVRNGVHVDRGLMLEFKTQLYDAPETYAYGWFLLGAIAGAAKGDIIEQEAKHRRPDRVDFNSGQFSDVHGGGKFSSENYQRSPGNYQRAARAQCVEERVLLATENELVRASDSVGDILHWLDSGANVHTDFEKIRKFGNAGIDPFAKAKLRRAVQVESEARILTKVEDVYPLLGALDAAVGLEMQDSRVSHFVVTGHSLGGAKAALFATQRMPEWSGRKSSGGNSDDGPSFHEGSLFSQVVGRFLGDRLPFHRSSSVKNTEEHKMEKVLCRVVVVTSLE